MFSSLLSLIFCAKSEEEEGANSMDSMSCNEWVHQFFFRTLVSLLSRRNHVDGAV